VVARWYGWKETGKTPVADNSIRVGSTGRRRGQCLINLVTYGCQGLAVRPGNLLDRRVFGLVRQVIADVHKRLREEIARSWRAIHANGKKELTSLENVT